MMLLGELLTKSRLMDNPAKSDTIHRILKYCLENYTKELSLSAYGETNIAATAICILVLLFAAGTFVWVFPLQARFHNTLRGVIKNACLFAVRYILLTFIMLALLVLLVIVICFMNQVTGYLLVTVGFSGYIYANVLIYDKISWSWKIKCEISVTKNLWFK